MDNSMIGKRFGRLTVLKNDRPFTQPSGQKQRAVLCVCSCGNTKRIRWQHIRRGLTQSCHCDSHGMTGTKLYGTWRSMKMRCKNPKGNGAEAYRKKKLTYYHRWEKFKGFKEWALNNGYKEGLQIDRVDNILGYYPANCRFVNQIENSANRDNTFWISYNGKAAPFMLLIRKKKLFKHHQAIRARIRRGWPYNKAIDAPIRKGNYKGILAR